MLHDIGLVDCLRCLTIHLEGRRLVGILSKSLGTWGVESAWTVWRSIFLLTLNELLKGALSKSSHGLLELVALPSVLIEVKLAYHSVVDLRVRIHWSCVLSVDLRCVVGVRIKARLFWWEHWLPFEAIESCTMRRLWSTSASDWWIAITSEVIYSHWGLASWFPISLSMPIQVILIADKSAFVLIKIITLFRTVIQSYMASHCH